MKRMSYIFPFCILAPKTCLRMRRILCVLLEVNWIRCLGSLWVNGAGWVHKTLQIGCKPALYTQRRKTHTSVSKPGKQSNGSVNVFRAVAKAKTEKLFASFFCLSVSCLLFSACLRMWKSSQFIVPAGLLCPTLFDLFSAAISCGKEIIFSPVSKWFPKCWASVLIRVLLSTSKSFPFLGGVNCSSEELRVRNELCGFLVFQWDAVFPYWVHFWIVFP